VCIVWSYGCTVHICTVHCALCTEPVHTFHHTMQIHCLAERTVHCAPSQCTAHTVRTFHHSIQCTHFITQCKYTVLRIGTQVWLKGISLDSYVCNVWPYVCTVWTHMCGHLCVHCLACTCVTQCAHLVHTHVSTLHTQRAQCTMYESYVRIEYVRVIFSPHIRFMHSVSRGWAAQFMCDMTRWHASFVHAGHADGNMDDEASWLDRAPGWHSQKSAL